MTARVPRPIRSDDPAPGSPRRPPGHQPRLRLVNPVRGHGAADRVRVLAPAGRPVLCPAAAAVLARIIRSVRDVTRQDGSITGGDR